MKYFDIWAEGYLTNGGFGGAIHLGKCCGETFKQACENKAKIDKDFKKYFNSETMTYWGCKLFDNESDARKTFG
jgi:hypothetical protein